MRVEILRECNTSRGYALPGPKHPEFSDVEAHRLIDQGHAREWVEPGETPDAPQARAQKEDAPRKKRAQNKQAPTKKRTAQKKRAPQKAAVT